jgi:ABC-type transporter Mla MlaB component
VPQTRRVVIDLSGVEMIDAAGLGALISVALTAQIQQRACELYEQRGRTDGYDLDDWLQAEREIKGRQAKAKTA